MCRKELEKVTWLWLPGKGDWRCTILWWNRGDSGNTDCRLIQFTQTPLLTKTGMGRKNVLDLVNTSTGSIFSHSERWIKRSEQQAISLRSWACCSPLLMTFQPGLRPVLIFAFIIWIRVTWDIAWHGQRQWFLMNLLWIQRLQLRTEICNEAFWRCY